MQLFHRLPKAAGKLVAFHFSVGVFARAVYSSVEYSQIAIELYWLKKNLGCTDSSNWIQFIQLKTERSRHMISSRQPLGRQSSSPSNMTSAVVVGTFATSLKREDCREHLDELISLLETHGTRVLGKVECPLREMSPATFLASGKLEEIKVLAQEVGADHVVFDDELTPPQQRNLEKFFRLPVADRTEIILRIFDQRAQTKEARLQIELAKIKYQAPRLTKLWSHLSRQRGGGTNQKGEGEAQLEIDRRLLRQRMTVLEKELRGVAQNRKLQQARRERNQIPEIAIVGYTNAGKSTLLNLLTNAGVFVEDKLFATLDTTTRRMVLPNHQRVLLTDTVGFIRKLPHQLVAAFRSTLEQSLRADLLIQLVDASHPNAHHHLEATDEVLRSLGAQSKPRLVVLNKLDLVEAEVHFRLKLHCGSSVSISALQNDGIAQLLKQIELRLSKDRSCVHLKIPLQEQTLLHKLYETSWVQDIVYTDHHILVQAEVPASEVKSVTPYLHKSGEGTRLNSPFSKTPPLTPSDEPKPQNEGR